MKLQLKQADSKLQEVMKQLTLLQTKLKEAGGLLRGSHHSPDLKRVEMYLSKARETVTNTSKSLKADIAQLPDVSPSKISVMQGSASLPQWAIVLIGGLCGAGIFALCTAGISAISSLSTFLRQSMPWWFLLALVLEAVAACAAGYITGILSSEKSRLNATIVGGILAGLVLLMFGYKSSWYTLHIIIPFLSCLVGNLCVEQQPLSAAPEQPEKKQQSEPAQSQTSSEEAQPVGK
jgi:hypothetical protein